jgi:hypothetical protein
MMGKNVYRISIAVVMIGAVNSIAPAGEKPHPFAAPRVTSLTNKAVRFTVPKEHYIVLKRGGISATVVDNDAVDVPGIAPRRRGYSGIAVLKRGEQDNNPFIPVALNFEHIHDGTLTVNKERFEPRAFPMELRKIDEHTAEVYQAPTPNWKLESCGRYHLLEDGTVEYTFECIPRADLFKNGYIGLFWASYIKEPEDRAIHFLGHGIEDSAPRWIRAVTPKHGTESTHPPAGNVPNLKLDPAFPLTLVSGRSKYTYAEPWYYGVVRGHAIVQMFRARDRIWLAQSPDGGGGKNPAWDFQWFVPDTKVGDAYGFVMRMAYIPYESREQVQMQTRPHREALSPKK